MTPDNMQQRDKNEECRKLNVQEERAQRQNKYARPAVFTNMCMVIDENGNVAALDKVRGGYTGLTFPGGHLEPGESACESVIREVYEETGLTIANPVFGGIYHWEEDGIFNIIFLYRAEEFSGALKSSEEGSVFWIPLAEFKQRNLAEGMEHVIRILSEGDVHECRMEKVNGIYEGKLY